MLVTFPLNKEKRGMFFFRVPVLDVKSEYRQSEGSILSKGSSYDWGAVSLRRQVVAGSVETVPFDLLGKGMKSSQRTKCFLFQEC